VNADTDPQIDEPDQGERLGAVLVVHGGNERVAE
jgi:hypothetical protein